jgi:hypothetical protein
VDDTRAILATVTDYWEGWFEGDAERMERALEPGLTKTGVGIDPSGGLTVAVMTAQDMIGWTRDGVGPAERPADPTFEVTIDDIHHRIATVTVRSRIYREYLHLVRTPSGWRIVDALYMRMPEGSPDHTATAALADS